ncbi:MAG: hypothetical protein ACKPKO_47495, partial [Candidatus Fonsibacter sp.]
VKSALQIQLGRMPTRKEINDIVHNNIKLADGSRNDYIKNSVKPVLIIYAWILDVLSLADINCGTR